MYFLFYSLFLGFKTSELIQSRFIMQKMQKEQFLVNRQKQAKDLNHISFNYEKKKKKKKNKKVKLNHTSNFFVNFFFHVYLRNTNLVVNI